MSVGSLRAEEVAMFYFLVQGTGEIQKAGNARDGGMASVFEKIKSLRFARAKAVLWAHDGHLAEDFPHASVPGGSTWKSMGSTLKEIYHSGYAAVGLTGYDVKTHWPDQPESSLPLPPKGSLEFALHSFGLPVLLLDTKESMDRARQSL